MGRPDTLKDTSTVKQEVDFQTGLFSHLSCLSWSRANLRSGRLGFRVARFKPDVGTLAMPLPSLTPRALARLASRVSSLRPRPHREPRSNAWATPADMQALGASKRRL